MNGAKHPGGVEFVQGSDGRRDSLRPSSQLRVTRPILNQPAFDANYGLIEHGPPLRPWGEIKRISRKLWKRGATTNKSASQLMYSYLIGWFPFIYWVPRYQFKKLVLPDLIAGITVGVMNVPQGIAYAILAGLPPVCGLYTSLIPTIMYFAMGTSRQCSMGTFAIVSMMTNKIVLQNAGNMLPTTISPMITTLSLGNETTQNFSVTTSSSITALPSDFTEHEMRTIKVAAAAAFAVGVWQLLFGVLGFGALTVYLSDQLVQGFTCSSAFHVFTSQLKSVFGVKDLPEYHGPFKLIKSWITFFKVINTAHPPTMIIAAVTIVVLIIIKYGINRNKKYKSIIPVPVPAELVVVIIGASVSYSYDFAKRLKVSTVANVPTGLPPFTTPAFEIVPDILGDTFALAIVAFAITVTLGMLFASKHNYSISPNQEFKALGAGNVIGSFFQCFPSGASLARSAVQESVGGRTQLVTVVQCSIVLTVILALGPLLEPLPRACLGGIIMVAVIHLLEQAVELKHLWKLSFVDWTIFLVVFLAVLILDVDIGVGIGVAYAVMTVMFRLQKPKVRGLGRLPGTDLYKPLDVYTVAYQRPEVKVVRIDAPIYFANAAYIKTRLYNLAGLHEAIHQMKESKDGTQEEEAKNYAYTNTLAIDEGEEQAVEKYDRRLSAVSSQRPSLVNGKIGAPDMKISEDLENGMNHGGNEVAPPGSVTLHVIVDCSEVSFIDVTGVSFLKKTAEECNNISVVLLLACTKKSVRDMLDICGAYTLLKPEHMFVTVHDAVLYALNAQEVSSSLVDETKHSNSGKRSSFIDTPM